MTVYLLSEDLLFPPATLAGHDGLLAIGGDFSPERLVLAYGQGIFPWPCGDMPLLWFSPEPRCVLPIERVHVGRSLRKVIRNTSFRVRVDERFRDVVDACATTKRPGQRGTWITDELRNGFIRLHERGLAHSIEAYDGNELIGGLYGVSLGSAFFGESMFAHRDDASKVAFVTLLGHLRAWGFTLVDCQVMTKHLASFGAVEVPRKLLLRSLHEALEDEGRVGAWSFSMTPGEALERVVER